MARSFQIASLFLDLTVLHNTRLALQGTRSSRFQMFRSALSYKNVLTKAEELLKSMDLWEKRNELVKSIAYGEQRKLEIALSLATGPKLLLLDEPSCGLTASESADNTSGIRALGTKITVVLVAHDIDLVFGVAHRIIVLHYGELIMDGTCDKIRTDPKVKEIYMGSEETGAQCSS
jgi:branched-chain amino acid transport system ATP-binding protein